MPTLAGVNLDAQFVMLKGEPGTRKSTCALSYPTPQYWVSTDKKMEALRLPAMKWGVDPKQISFDDYDDWEKPRAFLEKLTLGAPGDIPYKTIIVDSITSIGDNINRQTINVKGRERKDSGSGDVHRIGGIPINTIEDYKAEASAFVELMAILKDIHKFHNVNIILIAHVVGQRSQNEGNKLTHHSRVIVTGGDKISAKIAAYCTEVYHFNVKADFNVDTGEGEYGLYTVHTGNDFARTSLPLERRIIFNDRPLFEGWIAPAIKKLREMPPIQRIPPSPTQPPTTNSFMKG